ncbi:hypothetical protein [Streptomyces sp. NPDC053427]|uniref:hypothetical protein n=1 Tax=Streptomyces sp. NPDC053427 TaxID=3365701 RepID=UPI0037CFD7D6
MQRDTTSDAVGTGLSTEDLAQPKDAPPDEVPPDEVPPEPEATTEPARRKEADPSGDDEAHPLLTRDDEQGFRDRWNRVQSTFVDDPREAVQSADALVADVMQTLASTFAEQKQGLEGQWKRGEEANTEDLRKALRHYRSFFNRLLTA